VTTTTTYALDHMTAATVSLATSQEALAPRLQRAWHDHVQHVWEKPCLSPELAIEFRALWERYTAPAADPHSTGIRTLDETEERAMAADVVAFSIAVARDLNM
jgi:hypothetical protein